MFRNRREADRRAASRQTLQRGRPVGRPGPGRAPQRRMPPQDYSGMYDPYSGPGGYEPGRGRGRGRMPGLPRMSYDSQERVKNGLTEILVIVVFLSMLIGAAIASGG